MRHFTTVGVLFFLTLACMPCVAQDRGRPLWTSSKLSGSPDRPYAYDVELAFPNLRFSNPKSVVELPDQELLLVAHDGGKLVVFPKDSNVERTTLVADLAKIEQHDVGVNTVAFHPQFENNRYMFVAMGHGENGWHSRVMRFTLTKDEVPQVVPGSGKLIIRWPAGGHGGGCLGFGTDGFLYISTGDGSGPSPPDRLTTGQDITDLLGAVLRIDVDRRDGDKNYVVPSDNPFWDVENARPEIWSYGLRNPWKFGIDTLTGDIYVADNGWETWEVIHKLHRGSNCGWPIMEGRARLRTEVQRGPTPITPPIKDHPHTEANSVIGGPVYRGKQFGRDLDGTFIYGDYITGTVWGLTPNDNGQHDHRTLGDSEIHIVDIAEGSRGEIYLLDYDTTQQLYRLKKSTTPDTSRDFPRRLSETGLFADTSRLHPEEGVVEYTITAEPWNDRAVARRWVAVPGEGSIVLPTNDSRNALYPEGTVFVKHLSMPATESAAAKPIETQLLHYQKGVWNPYSYLWDDSGVDAHLIDGQGINHEVQFSEDPSSLHTWRVGSTNECRLCHNAGSGFILGFTPRQLQPRDGGTGASLIPLTKVGIVKASASANSAASLVDPYDSRANLDDRARSYLHVNCGVCHNRQGPATISFFMHRDYPFEDLRITKRPGIGSFGIQSPQLVAPGSPYNSIILYRLGKLGYGRMPYIGSRVVDSEGIALIESWIASLDPKKGPASTTTNWLAKLETTEGALEVMAAMHRGLLTKTQARDVVEEVQTAHGDIRGLFDHFVPEPERKVTVGENPDPARILNLDGDSSRGRLIFFSDDARCKSCHDVTDAAKSLGPTLAEIRKKYVRRTDMLDHVISPSKTIDDKFKVWTVLTTSGKLQSGVLLERTADRVRLMSTDRTPIEISNDEIEEIEMSDRSIMPNGVLSDLTFQEAADLLKFLMSP